MHCLVSSLILSLMKILGELPHSAMKKTPNYMMLSWELRLAYQLQYGGAVNCSESMHKYTQVIQDQLTQVYELMTTDNKHPPLFKTGDLAWMISK